MKSSTIFKVFAALITVLLVFSFLPAHMASANFNNGGFEGGDFTSWNKSTYLNNGLNCTTGGACIVKDAGGSDLTSLVGGPSVAPRSQSDANTGGVLTYPYNGHYTAVVNYLGNNQNANEMTQQIATSSADVSSDGNIHVYFVYAPVLQNPAHAATDQPYMYIKLTDDTKGTTLFDSFVWAGDGNPNWQYVNQGSGSEVDFMDWQVQNLSYDSSQIAAGDNVTMDVIAAGCALGGHWGYVYVDDFGTHAPTVTSVTADVNPQTLGQPVQFTASVTSLVSGTITGSVDFYDGTTLLGSGTVSGGTATYTTSSLTAGTHQIHAVYDGDGTYLTSTSVDYAEQINSPYAVTYDGNGSTSGTVPVDPSSPYTAGTTVTVLGNTGTLAKTGYTFSGWNTQSGGGGSEYVAGNTFTMPGNIVTLYAQWTINSYTLTYTAGVHGSLTGTLHQTVNYGASGTAVTAVAISGYHFVVWSDGSTANPRTDTNVTASISVKASFLPEHVLNGGFNTYVGASKIPQYWEASNFKPTDGKDLTNHQEGTASVKIVGAPGVTKTLTQTIAFSGLAGDVFYFSFQAKGNAIPVGGVCEGQVKLYNGATLVSTGTINCATGIYGFQLNTLNLTAAKAYNKVVVVFTYKEASGTVWFDAASAASPANH